MKTRRTALAAGAQGSDEDVEVAEAAGGGADGHVRAHVALQGDLLHLAGLDAGGEGHRVGPGDVVGRGLDLRGEGAAGEGGMGEAGDGVEAATSRGEAGQ